MTSTTTTTWLGQRPLEAAILWYRRRLSGRGPLRRVTCTFGRCESCSAYGLRIVQRHGTSLLHALRLILGRIGRCRTSSVYRRGRALLWGADFDRLEQVDPDAVAHHEQPKTRRALLRAAIALARYRGERRILRRLVDRLRSLTRTASASTTTTTPAMLPLRSGRRLLEHLRLRWLRLLVLPVSLGALAIGLPLWPGGLLGLLALALAGASTARFLRERHRFDRQIRLGRFAPT